ncbi:MAG: hypothetical protein ACN6P5_17215 [Pseudomonas protegens]|uniref:hypothetical protein n=1 Tax=Pseudomonas protegens TaxID=380021 RepID=UPI00383BBDFE
MFGALSGLAQADSTTAAPYRYAMPLHVAKVTSMSEPEPELSPPAVQARYSLTD